jgi:two-component system phosphate regulon sensor histidine kinase PhoR
MQKDFINNMTHEFKTPISTIKISANTFLNHPSVKSDERLLQYAKIINEQNERLNSQVEKVLQLARIERDNFKLNLEEVQLHELLESTAESTRLKLNESGGTLKTELKATRTLIKADRLHLTNLLHNLLDNAIKYCKGHPEIIVKTENAAGNHLRLTIADRGIGISKEYQSRVFEKFFRVPTGNVHDVKGFGLGLFYIKNVCSAHGWKIELESEPGKGTEIRILI